MKMLSDGEADDVVGYHPEGYDEWDMFEDEQLIKVLLRIWCGRCQEKKGKL